MTTLLTNEPDSWTTPPGWGIFADLTPPELHNARRLASIRRMLIGLVALVIVGIVLGYGYARWQSDRAAGDVAAQQALTTQLQAQQLRYAPVVELQGSVAAVNVQLAQLMVSDVDFRALVESVSAATPRGVQLTSEQVTISTAGAAAAAGTTSSLDTSGIPQIGNITIAGTVSGLPGFAAYLVDLAQVKGVTNVVPGATSITGNKITFGVTMTVTDVLLSHHYDIATPTASPAAATPEAAATSAVTTAAGQ